MPQSTALAPYRVSKFVDFNTGVVFLDPERFVERHGAEQWKEETEIELFHCRIDVWQLAPAAAILKQIEAHDHPSVWSHAAYSLLFVLNSYFETIGKILSDNASEYNSSHRDFNRGFVDVYPNLPITRRVPGTIAYNDNAFPAVAQLRDRMRNGMAHLGFTKKTFLIHNSDGYAGDFELQPIGVSRDDPNPLPVYLAKPHQITRTIIEHFGHFVDKLRRDTTLHPAFMKFANEFHDPHSVEMPQLSPASVS